MKHKSLITFFLIFFLFFTFIPSLVQAPTTFMTTTDNADNAGTFGSPDGDMDAYIFGGAGNEPIEFYIITTTGQWSQAMLTLRVWDVDVFGGEIDNVYVNGNLVGQLSGSQNSWNITIITFDPTFLDVSGNQLISIDITSPWAITVDWGELELIPASLPVGGEILSINKIQLVLPYLLLVATAIATAGIIFKKRYL